MAVIREVIEATVAALETIPDLTLSPAALAGGNTPDTIAERVFSVTMQTENTDKFRDRQPAGHMRLDHVVTVDLLCSIFPNDQMNSYKNAMDIEELILEKMLVQSNFPAYRVSYERSRRDFAAKTRSRTGTVAGEYILISMDFSIEQSMVLS